MFRYGFKKKMNDLGADYGATVLAAVSGGMDSMCMLDALVHCQLDLQIAVAHVNFNLRGQESDQDTAMVEQWCNEHNITLHKASFNTREYAQKKHISIEMAARELRYNWFYQLMAENGYNFLAIAHNANDNAETLMLNLTRGCGIEGLAGIKAKVQINNNQHIIRPLISYSRQQIEKYAAYHKVPYRTDSTNLENDFSRNRIRNIVFPELARINPSVIATFNRDIRHFQQAGSVLQKHINEKLATLCHRFEYFGDLLASPFAHNFCGLNLRANCITAQVISEDIYPENYSTNVAENYSVADGENYFAEDGENYEKNLSGREVQLSVIKCIVEIDKLMQEQEWEFWVYQIAAGYGFAPAIIEDICNSLLEEAGPKKFMQRDGEYVAVKERGLLKFYLNAVHQEPAQIETTIISRESWRTRKAIGSELCPTLYMDAAKIKEPLTCRPVAAGDRFSPLGLRGSKKVTDYLSDIKFENLHKGNVLVMCDANGEIICIPGLQISNKVRVTEATGQILQVGVR